MKLSFKNILPVLLIFTLLILFAGCFITPSDEQPGYTPGTITGIIAAPCCSSTDPVTELSCVYSEYWCCYCENTWSLQDDVEVILTYGEDEVATTTTNELGEYTFTDVEPGKNYVITALCPDYDDDRPLVKDVALELVEGGSFDTKITDCVSTSLGLVVDFLVTYSELGPEEIVLDGVIASIPNFYSFPEFKKLVLRICEISTGCVNLFEDEKVMDYLCRAAEEVGQIVLPDLDLGCTPGYTPTTHPPTGACAGNVAPVISSVFLGDTAILIGETVHVVVETPYVVTVNASDDGNRYPLTYSASVGGVSYGPINSNTINITLGAVGEYLVSVSVYDGCATTPWGPVTVVVDPVSTYTLTMAVSPADGGITNPLIGPHSGYAKDFLENISAIANPGYHFVNWTVDTGAAALAPNSNSTTVVVDANKTVTANFAADVLITLTMAVSPEGSGTTTPTIGSYDYPTGTEVEIKALANEGYFFVNWTVDTGTAALAPGSDSTTVVVDTNKTVTANFALENLFEGGVLTIAFEDMEIPRRGSSDYDYNDWVVDLTINTIYAGDTPNLASIRFDILPEARGAGYDHRFHILIPAGTFAQGGESKLEIIGLGASTDVKPFNTSIDNDFEVIPDTRAALGGELHNHTNTKENEGPTAAATTAVLTIVFDASFYHDFSQYDPYNSADSMHGEGLFFDPYLEVDAGTPNHQFDEPASYDIHTGDKRILTVPHDWDWPEEGIAIWNVYSGVSVGDPPIFTDGWWTSHNNCVYGDDVVCP
jgi:LruC domain-containing protein